MYRLLNIRRWHALRAAVCAAPLLLCVACAPRYTTAALGQYDLFQPFVTSSLPASTTRTRPYEIELARTAHVAFIAIAPPAGGYSDRPVVYDVLYPLYDTDRTQFGAGRHRLLSRRTTMMEPMNCSVTERPTLSGCRRALRHLPGLVDGRPPAGPLQYLLLAADEPIDPYTIADELFFSTREQPPLHRALMEGDTEAAASLIERILLDRRGTPVWAGLYVVTH